MLIYVFSISRSVNTKNPAVTTRKKSVKPEEPAKKAAQISTPVS